MDKRKSPLWVAVPWLWVAAVISAAMLPGVTMAKYAAQAEGSGSAGVARWDVHDRDTEFVPEEEEPDERPLLLFGSGPSTTVVTLPNNSEVTARYQLIPQLADDDGDLPVISIAGVAGTGVTYHATDLWVVVPYETTAEVTLEIQPAVFKRLAIFAQIEQVD